MKWTRHVSLSRRALGRQRTRTVLALSSCAVGVATLLVMVAVGAGAEHDVVSRVQAMGRNMLVVSAAPAPRRAGRAYQAGATAETLTLADAEALAERSGFVTRVAPSQDVAKQITYLDRSTFATVRGTTAEYEHIRAFSPASGRFFTPEENRAALRVAVLGSQIAQRLFPDVDPIDEVIRIGRVPFVVVGVLVEKGISVDGAAEEDGQVIVPINTALRRLFRVDYLKMVYLEVALPTLLDEAAGDVAAILRERHGLAHRDRADDFTIQNQQVIMEVELAAVTAFRRLTVGMGTIALLVGGVGILSIMLLSVRARRSEIGLRVAVGARRRDVWMQFLIEATAVGAAGGLLGVLLGVGASWLVSATTEWMAIVTPTAVATASGSALAVGVVFGVYPALQAARWQPIEALRP